MAGVTYSYYVKSGQGSITESETADSFSLLATPANGWLFDRWDYQLSWKMYEGDAWHTGSESITINPFVESLDPSPFYALEYQIGAVFVQRTKTGELLCTGSDSSAGAGKMLCDSSGNLLYDG